jgi:hypothetical protein
MKKLLFGILFLIIFVCSCYGQMEKLSHETVKKMSEQECIKESKIDFSTQVIFFEISGEIEIDGHIINNAKRESPIIFIANLDGVTIMDTSTGLKYGHRVCDRKGCKIIHLTAYPIFKAQGNFYWQDLRLDNNGNVPCKEGKEII